MSWEEIISFFKTELNRVIVKYCFCSWYAGIFASGILSENSEMYFRSVGLEATPRIRNVKNSLTGWNDGMCQVLNEIKNKSP